MISPLYLVKNKKKLDFTITFVISIKDFICLSHRHNFILLLLSNDSRYRNKIYY